MAGRGLLVPTSQRLWYPRSMLLSLTRPLGTRNVVVGVKERLAFKSFPGCGGGRVWERNTRQTVAASSSVRISDAELSASASQGEEKGRKRRYRTSDGPTFQDALNRLQAYWSSVGCTLWLPHSTEGTMNPATFLRVLGPEPWNICYAEPSHRPDDSRYGDNPNRVQRHTQFQVILKPDPGNPQELYLGSLEALGIDTCQHDVRFVEDNWESPVLGAWGLGWEVWLDGMEVTQFTYFQQSGGIQCKPVAVEITYGLERILMALQGVEHFKDIQFSDNMTYGELLLQNEQEMSAYNLDVADVAAQRKRFDIYEAEVESLLERRLPIPAYDHILKASHAFNVMDARGAVGVTERQKLFARMRNLTKGVSKLWLERRKELEFPLLVNGEDTIKTATKTICDGAVEGGRKGEEDPADFVLEIGSEELPANYVDIGVAALSTSIPKMLDSINLAHAGIKVNGTPRRLTVRIAQLNARQPDATERLRGPPVKVAFSSEGEGGGLTKAGEGFARKNGVDASSLERDGDYVYATVFTPGRPAAEVLAEELPAVLKGIRWPKSMRWQGEELWPRPLRWILSLHGTRVVNFTALGISSSSSSMGMRRRRIGIEEATKRDLDLFQVKSASDYDVQIEAQGIVLEEDVRKQRIWEMCQSLAAEEGGEGACILETHRGLLDEVTNLVESPYPLLGHFDPSFLSLPKEVLEVVMKKHQRYFPVTSCDGESLLPCFITVANGKHDPETVIKGNEAVLRARYADARFFFDADSSTPLADFRAKLQGTMFQEKLGTMLEKAERTELLVGKFLLSLESQTGDDGLSESEAVTCKEAAPLMYADLATLMVMEFTGLAGTMGRHYARAQGHPPAVCDAIYESVLPRQANDTLPETKPGALLSLASRFDSLMGLFAAKCSPSASADPYGLRRIAYGLVEVLLSSGIQLNVIEALRSAAALQPVMEEEKVSEEAIADAANFIARRLEQLLVDRGYDVELVRAILAERANDPAAAVEAVQALSTVVKEDEEFQKLLTSLARPARIVRAHMEKEASFVEGDVDTSLLTEGAERELWTTLSAVKEEFDNSPGSLEALQAAYRLIVPIDNFFDSVFVMAEDAKVRQNRLSLLCKVANITRGHIDMSYLPGF